MAVAAMAEAVTKGTEILARSTMRPLTPKDYKSWKRVAKSAWGINEINKPWDFVALTENNIPLFNQFATHLI